MAVNCDRGSSMYHCCLIRKSVLHKAFMLDMILLQNGEQVFSYI